MSAPGLVRAAQAERVEAVLRLRHVARQDARGERQRDDADRQVDEEDPAPGDVVDEPAAEDRAQDRAEQHRDADDAHHAADALRAGGAGEDRHAERHQHAAAEALQHAEGDQRLRRPGEARERRADEEEGDREHVEPLGAEAVGGPAGERDHGRQRERVAGRRPTGSSSAGVEVSRERVDGDVDDRHVEDRHDRAEHDDGGDEEQRAVERPRTGEEEGKRRSRAASFGAWGRMGRRIAVDELLGEGVVDGLGTGRRGCGSATARCRRRGRRGGAAASSPRASARSTISVGRPRRPRDVLAEDRRELLALAQAAGEPGGELRVLALCWRAGARWRAGRRAGCRCPAPAAWLARVQADRGGDQLRLALRQRR